MYLYQPFGEWQTRNCVQMNLEFSKSIYDFIGDFQWSDFQCPFTWKFMVLWATVCHNGCENHQLIRVRLTQLPSPLINRMTCYHEQQVNNNTESKINMIQGWLLTLAKYWTNLTNLFFYFSVMPWNLMEISRWWSKNRIHWLYQGLNLLQKTTTPY